MNFTDGLIEHAENRGLTRFRSVVRIGNIEYRSPAVGLDVMVAHSRNNWEKFAYIEGIADPETDWQIV